MAIYVRGHSLRKCTELRRLGASGVVSENVETSLELARMALVNVGFDDTKREDILGEFRKSYYAQINGAVRSKDTDN
jgi:voltage-gated potassium channel Kch